jgi:hypothetical protein
MIIIHHMNDILLPRLVIQRLCERLGDTKHLRAFRAEYGRKARPGLLLHNGEELDWLASNVLMAPWWMVV